MQEVERRKANPHLEKATPLAQAENHLLQVQRMTLLILKALRFQLLLSRRQLKNAIRTLLKLKRTATNGRLKTQEKRKKLKHLSGTRKRSVASKPNKSLSRKIHLRQKNRSMSPRSQKRFQK